MAEETPNHTSVTLKRTFPFEHEETRLQLKEPPSILSSTQIDEPLCLLGSVRPG
jgi:hypothetical protein